MRRSNRDTLLTLAHGGILHWIFVALMNGERVGSLGTRNMALFDFTLDWERWRYSDGHDDTSL